MAANGLSTEVVGDKTIVKVPRDESGIMKLDEFHPSDEARVCMARLFGFSIDEQLRIESEINPMNMAELLHL